jgi:hypothetical protein
MSDDSTTPGAKETLQQKLAKARGDLDKRLGQMTTTFGEPDYFDKYSEPDTISPEKEAKLAALMAETLPAIEERVKEVGAMGAISTPGLLDEVVGGAPETATGEHQDTTKKPVPISDEDRPEFAQDAAHHPALSAPFSDPPPS